MMTNKEIHSNLAIPPGEYLEEVLDELGMTKDELAHRMGRPATKLSAIFSGEKAITPDTALQLETVVGVPAHIWTGLEAEYRLTLARQEQEKKEEQLKEEIELVKNFPFKELVKAGEIERQTKPKERVRTLQEFFGVVSLKRVPDIKRYQPDFRVGKAVKGEISSESITAWLRMGERRAHRINCESYSEDRLREALNEIRAMTLQNPSEFQDELESKLANCGIALVICPHFPKTKTHGATFWIGHNKAVLMITLRYKWTDIFWFSLFHEIGHIVLHSKKAVILDGSCDEKLEREADKFAADLLIPSEAYRRFIHEDSFYESDIIEFAREIGIDPGIVAGRLQHDGLLEQQFGNNIRTRYKWK